MPKTKEFVSSSDSDSDSEARPKAKKAKKEKKENNEKSEKSEKAASNVTKAGDGTELLELSKMKYVSVSEFRGRKFVNIREYYNDSNTGDLKPGKKGIALDKGQWEKLKSYMNELDQNLD